jgi:hypothetical protein
MPKSAEKIAAFAFGVVFVIVMLVLAVFIPNPTASQYTTFRIVLALAAGGVAAMIPGFLTFKISTWLRAGGALAVFAIVYFYSPAGAVSNAELPKRISINLHRIGLTGDCPNLPASAQIKVIPVAGQPYPPLNIVGGCKAMLPVPVSSVGSVSLQLIGATPYELANPEAVYQLNADDWEGYITDTPGMHLLISLFSYAGQCSNLENVYLTFESILRSKAQSLRGLFSDTDHRYDYLNSVNVISAGRALNMSTAEIDVFWHDNGSLQILSGLCVSSAEGEVMRSSIFSGPLAAHLPEPLIVDLKVDENEFATTRDIYSASMLFALAREAKTRNLDQDIVISYLGRAREVATQIRDSAGQSLLAAIDRSLSDAGAPSSLTR